MCWKGAKSQAMKTTAYIEVENVQRLEAQKGIRFCYRLELAKNWPAFFFKEE